MDWNFAEVHGRSYNNISYNKNIYILICNHIILNDISCWRSFRKNHSPGLELDQWKGSCFPTCLTSMSHPKCRQLTFCRSSFISAAHAISITGINDIIAFALTIYAICEATWYINKTNKHPTIRHRQCPTKECSLPFTGGEHETTTWLSQYLVPNKSAKLAEWCQCHPMVAESLLEFGTIYVTMGVTPDHIK